MDTTAGMMEAQIRNQNLDGTHRYRSTKTDRRDRYWGTQIPWFTRTLVNTMAVFDLVNLFHHSLFSVIRMVQF
ncbi:unnamed protein product [Boreogadus saida]